MNSTNSNCWRDPQSNPSNPEAHPFRVSILRDDNTPGLHGWSYRCQVFATLDEALLVAACLMPKGCREVTVDVAKNRSTWTSDDEALHGYWEPVGGRKNRKTWTWSKGWSKARADKVREYLAKKS